MYIMSRPLTTIITITLKTQLHKCRVLKIGHLWFMEIIIATFKNDSPLYLVNNLRTLLVN